MGGQSSGRQLIDTDDWMRRIEKRLMHEERRPQIRTASDLMGPGLGPKAVQLFDWNDDITLFNGFFWSEPGPAQHSPDNTKHWMGYNVVNLNGNGYQRVYEYRDALDVSTVATWVRRFRTPPGLSRIFESWVQATGSGGGGGDTPTRLPGMMLGAVGTTNVVAVSTYASVIWGGATDAGNVDPAMWSAADPTKVFAPVAGRYNINGTVVFQNNATGYRHIYVRKVRASDGGTQALEWVLLPPANGNVTVIPYAIGEVLMAVGDYITIECYHAGTGASIWVGGSSGSAVTRIAMTYVAAPDGSTVPRPLSRYGAVTGQTAIAINAAASIPITFAPVPNTDYAVIVNPDAVDFTTTALSKTTSGCTVWLRNKSTTANLSPNFTWQVVHGGA